MCKDLLAPIDRGAPFGIRKGRSPTREGAPPGTPSHLLLLLAYAAEGASGALPSAFAAPLLRRLRRVFFASVPAAFSLV